MENKNIIAKIVVGNLLKTQRKDYFKRIIGFSRLENKIGATWYFIYNYNSSLIL